MAVFSRIVSFIMAIFMIGSGSGSGTGTSTGSNIVLVGNVGTSMTRQKMLSEQYQRGLWNGSPTGLPKAQVVNGLLYVGDKESDYPADSSEPYMNDRPIISIYGKGTWFKHDMVRKALKLRLDYRGKNIKTIDFTEVLINASDIKVELSEDNADILVRYIENSRHYAIHIPVDPDYYTSAH